MSVQPDGLTARGWRIAAADVSEAEKRAQGDSGWATHNALVLLPERLARLERIEARARREAGRALSPTPPDARDEGAADCENFWHIHPGGTPCAHPDAKEKP